LTQTSAQHLAEQHIAFFDQALAHIDDGVVGAVFVTILLGDLPLTRCGIVVINFLALRPLDSRLAHSCRDERASWMPNGHRKLSG
jgi:hypothetical protein